jgi:hypothetical protein
MMITKMLIITMTNHSALVGCIVSILEAPKSLGPLHENEFHCGFALHYFSLCTDRERKKMVGGKRVYTVYSSVDRWLVMQTRESDKTQMSV